MPLDLSGGAASSVAVATPASHGTTTVAGISIFYTPTPGYVGSDSFTYTATNVAGTSAPATISITVNPPPPSAPVVTTPVPGSQVGSFPALVGIADANTTIIIADIGGTELFRTFSMPGGQWSVTFPTPLGLGVQTFRITGEDALGTTSTTTVFTAEVVAPPTAPPVSVTVPYGSPGYPIPLASTGGPATAVGIHAAPLHGGLQLNGTVVTYIPDAGYHGPDSFDYVLKGPGGDSAILTAHVTVTAPAGASDKTVTIPPGGIPAPIDLAAGLPGTISASIGAVVPAEAGSARLVSEGGSHFLHFTPSPYFAGTSSVDFTLVGPDGTSSARVIFNHVYDAAFIQGRVEQQVDSSTRVRACCPRLFPYPASVIASAVGRASSTSRLTAIPSRSILRLRPVSSPPGMRRAMLPRLWRRAPLIRASMPGSMPARRSICAMARPGRAGAVSLLFRWAPIIS
jgi:hypothetical protein